MNNLKEFNIANDPETTAKELEELAKSKDEHIKAAVALNTNANQGTLLSLVGSGSDYILDNLLLNPVKFNGNNFQLDYCKHTKLRLIKEEDAPFLLSLRLNETLNKHLSKVDNNLTNQIEWIKHYKIREQERLEFYFIITSQDNQPLGTVRLYDFQGSSFCWGSWIIKEKSPTFTAIESALSIYEFAFNVLSFKSSHFDVRKDNTKVIKFHKNFGAKETSEDINNFYFKITKEDYEIKREKYKKFFK